MKTTRRLLTVAIICLTMAVFGASAQARGGQRSNQNRQTGHATISGNKANISSHGQASSPSFNRGSNTVVNSRPVSSQTVTPARPGGSNVTPSRPSGNTPNNGGFTRPSGGNNRPGQQPGNVNPGNNNRPGQQPGNVNPGNNNRPGQQPGNSGEAFHRPDYGNRPGSVQPGHQPSHQPGHQPVHGSPTHRPGVPAPGIRPAPNTRPPVWIPRPRPWTAPRPPMHWRPAGVYPTFSTILGITLGTALNITLDHLLNQGYTVHSYGNDIVYLNNVNQLNMLWPDAQLYYTTRGLQRGDFIYATPYYDTARYNLTYSRLVSLYGNPVATTYPTDGFQTQWFGYDGRFVTLTYQPMYGNDGVLRYYTTLSFGW